MRPSEKYAIIGCVLARITVSLLFPSLQTQLDKSVEFSTPMTSYRSLCEGVFMLRNEFPLYHGGVVHHPPLLIAFMSLIGPQSLVALLYALTDGLIAYQLICMAKCFRHSDIPNWLPGALYALNPLVLLSCVSQSSVIFANVFTSTAILCSLHGNVLGYAIAAGTASYLSPYHALIVVPALSTLPYGIKPKTKAAAFSVIVLAALFLTSYILMGSSWKFLHSVYWAQINFEKLFPNLGMWWYFFIEMFDMFIPFFKAVFNIFTLSFVAPFTIRFNKQPFYALIICLGWITLTKPYPTLGDAGFFLSFLPFFKPLFGYMRCPVPSTLLFIHAIVLSPIFYHLWVDLGSGNSNFFYAISLVYALALGSILVDLCWSMLRVEFDEGKPNYNLKVTQI
ncbi:GAB1 (YLR459W) [Zygosaccharomyces parabailii]|nr:GAB1 (YLR459W) [Zygosaccharomyces parabailii]CDH10544.1 probable GPI transamidase component GAB1 [Zygosaccharomyces bailii ISA1307]